jgi:hypothetical protein
VLEGIPRVHTVDVTLNPGESFHITPISDAHIDDSLCDLDALKKLADRRRTLENHHAILLGDTFNLVVPTDMKRYRPSVQPPQIAGRDDWVNATLRYVSNILKELNLTWAMISQGNHELEFEKRSGVDLTTLLAAEIGAFRAGYSGILDFRIHGTTKMRFSQTFRVAYHHGAWGGRTMKGYSGAWPFFSQIDGANIFLYGHNHASRVDPEIRRKVVGDKLIDYPVYLVNCGSFVRSYSEDARETHYAERQGYLPQPRTTPLIKVTRLPRNGNLDRKGIYYPQIEYSVTT